MIGITTYLYITSRCKCISRLVNTTTDITNSISNWHSIIRSINHHLICTIYIPYSHSEITNIFAKAISIRHSIARTSRSCNSLSNTNNSDCLTRINYIFIQCSITSKSFSCSDNRISYL